MMRSLKAQQHVFRYVKLVNLFELVTVHKLSQRHRRICWRRKFYFQTYSNFALLPSFRLVFVSQQSFSHFFPKFFALLKNVILYLTIFNPDGDNDCLAKLRIKNQNESQ